MEEKGEGGEREGNKEEKEVEEIDSDDSFESAEQSDGGSVDEVTDGKEGENPGEGDMEVDEGEDEDNNMAIEKRGEDGMEKTLGETQDGSARDGRSQHGGGTPKSASFAGDTNFTQKKYPGSHVKRSQQGSRSAKPPVKNPYAKASPSTSTATRTTRIHDHEHHTYLRVQITLKGEPDPPTAIIRTLGKFLSVLQAKDQTACIARELNVRKQIYSEEDFPADFRDFYDEWSYWEHDVAYFLMSVPLGGNGRSFHGTICLSSDWEGSKLLDQCVFAIRNIQCKGATIKASVKELQVLRTTRNFILFGIPSDVKFDAVTDLLRDLMNEALTLMVEYDRVRYPEESYHWLPDFSMVRMYVKNTPFEERDKNDPTPAWAKMPLHLEVDADFEDYVGEILSFMVNKRILQQVFGDYVWCQRNVAANKATTDDKNRMKASLRTHMAIVLSLGRVFFRGLENPDNQVVLRRDPDEKGKARAPITMTVRKLMRYYKVNGIRLWQFICPDGTGGWCGYYASGKVCDAHRILAEAWARSTAAHVRFKCVSRGVQQADITKFMRQTFSMSSAREGERARYVNGMIVSEQDASMLEVGQKIKACKWVNNAAVFTKGIEKESHARAFLDDDSQAYTFAAEQSVGGDTAALSLINPETGKEWREGERERHRASELEGAAAATAADDESIASRESDCWEQSRTYEFEGMEGVHDLGNLKGDENEAGEDEKEDVAPQVDGETRDLSSALMDALLKAGRVNPDEGRPREMDIKQVMRAAIEAISSKTPNSTNNIGQNQLEESNTGEDRQPPIGGSAGGPGP